MVSWCINSTELSKKQKLNRMKQSNKQAENKPCTVHDVVCSCYMCGKTIERPEEQLDMYGEIVCQDCWDYNMYQALQDGGGM